MSAGRRDGLNIEIIDDAAAAVYRRMRPDERLRVAFGLWSLARAVLVNGLRSLHPEWDEAKVQAEAGRRISHGAF